MKVRYVRRKSLKSGGMRQSGLNVKEKQSRKRTVAGSGREIVVASGSGCRLLFFFLRLIFNRL